MKARNPDMQGTRGTTAIVLILLKTAFAVLLPCVLIWGGGAIPINISFLKKFPLLLPLAVFIAILFVEKASTNKQKRQDSAESKINKITKHHLKILVILLLIALPIKWAVATGVTTHVTHVDEYAMIDGVLKVIIHPSLDYHYFAYPPFYFLMNTPIYKTYFSTMEMDKNNEQKIWRTPLSHWYTLGRVENAIVGTLIVMMSFILISQLFGTKWGLLAALITLISPMRLAVDSLVRLHPLSDLLALITMILILSILREEKIWKFCLLGLFVILAGMTFYPRGIVVVPLIILFLYLPRRKQTLINAGYFTLSAFVVLVPIASPMIYNPERAIEKFLFARNVAQTQFQFQGENTSFSNYAAITIWTAKDGVGYAAMGLAFWGILLVFFTRRKTDTLILSYILSHYLLFGVFIRGHDRYHAVLIPFFLVFSIRAIKTILGFLKERFNFNPPVERTIAIIIALSLLIPHLIFFPGIISGSLKPHVLDSVLDWKHGLAVQVPVISLIRSLKLGEARIIVTAKDNVLDSPAETRFLRYITRRYKYIICTPSQAGYLPEQWKLLKTFDYQPDRGGTVKVLENSTPLNLLKEDTQLTRKK